MIIKFSEGSIPAGLRLDIVASRSGLYLVLSGVGGCGWRGMSGGGEGECGGDGKG